MAFRVEFMLSMSLSSDLFFFFVSSNWKKNDSFEMATGFVGEIMNFSMGSQSNRDDGG